MESKELNNKNENLSTFEGILEILRTSPKESKEFCGKIIDLQFQHTVETDFSHFKNSDEMSIYSSCYSYIEDY